MTSRDAILDPEDARSRWRDLASLCPASSPFANVDFVEELSELFGWKCRSVFTPGAGVWIMQRRSGPFKEWVLAPFEPYSAIRYEAPEALCGLLDAIRSFSPGALIALEPGCPAPARLPPGWETREKQTYLMDLGQGQNLWSRTPKRTFRKHREEYELVEGSGAADTAIRLSADAYLGRGARMSLPPDVLVAFSEGLVTRGIALPLGVRNRQTGEVEAGLVILVGGDIAYSWIAGSIKGPAMTVLFGLAIERLFAEGIRHFDLVGANTPSIAEFKRQFGGELRTYPHLTFGPHPLLTSSRKILSLFR